MNDDQQYVEMPPAPPIAADLYPAPDRLQGPIDFAQLRSWARWAAEIVGVLLLAIAFGLWWLPLGLVIVGAYCIIIANSGGD